MSEQAELRSRSDAHSADAAAVRSDAAMLRAALEQQEEACARLEASQARVFLHCP